MVHIMKEMQSPKKFNSPMQRRNQFGQLLPIPIRKGDTIIQGVPIEITCNTYLDGEENMGRVANVGPPNDHPLILNGQSYILMDNEEEQRLMKEHNGGSFLDQNNLKSQLENRRVLAVGNPSQVNREAAHSMIEKPRPSNAVAEKRAASISMLN